MRNSLLPIAILSLACSAVAQQALVPAANKDNQGASWHFKPYNDTNQVFQQWMTPADVNLPDGVKIVGVSFVRECNFGTVTGNLNTANYVAPDVVFDLTEIRLGDAAAALGTNVAANYASGTIPATPNWAMKGWKLPGYTSPGPDGVPTYIHKLTVPHVYNAKVPLLLEVRHVAGNQTNVVTNYNVDRTLISNAQATIRGFGCPAGDNTVPYILPTAFAEGVSAAVQVTNTSTTVTAHALLVGFQHKTVFSGPPGLPLNTLFGGPFFDPACALWVDPTWSLPAGTTFPLVYSFGVVPAGLHGLPVTTQSVFLDKGVKGGLNMSQATYAFVMNNPATTQGRYVYFTGNGDTSTSASPQPTLLGPFAGFDTVIFYYAK